MDVTCDRCGTDYEFEETLVSARGTTVKCTRCGHLFKVWKKGAAEESSEADATSEPSSAAPIWTIRRTDGSIHKLTSLAALTSRIGEGVFAREDQVSRTGKAWKRLGEIDELSGFFPDSERPVTRPRRRSKSPELGLRPSQPAPGNLPRGISAPPPSPQEPVAAPHRRSDKPEPTRFETMGGAVDITHRAAATTDADAMITAKRPPVSSEPAQAPHPQVQARPAPTAPQPARPTPGEAPRGSAAVWPWLLLGLVAAGAIAALLLWPRVGQRLATPPPRDPTAEFVARADAAFATHRLQHFEDAVTDYVKALAFHESDPHLLSSIARVQAVWAQELRWKRAALEARPSSRKNVNERSEIVALEKEERQLVEQARRYAEAGARKNPGNEEAEVALADALRLSGNLVAARSELDRARATQTEPTAETLRVAALLASDEAGFDLRAAVKLASQAVAAEPETVRMRLLLARALIAERDFDGARYQLDAVASRDRAHPGMLAVDQELALAQQPKAAEPVDAGTKDAAAPAPLPFDPNAPPENLSHEGHIARGQALLEKGFVAQAKRMFEQALFIRPTSAAAHTGLGYVALEKGRAPLAVEHFLPAARAGNVDAFIGLGDAYRRLGRERDALKAYQSYLSRAPAGKHASIARAQIERLEERLGR